MTFATAVNCMDGRVQLPVIEYLTGHYPVDYIDTITEAGPVRFLAEQSDDPVTASILQRVDISVRHHRSILLAVVAHHDCAGNARPEACQRQQLQQAREYLNRRYPDLPVLALWVDEQWQVEPVGKDEPAGAG